MLPTPLLQSDSIPQGLQPLGLSAIQSDSKAQGLQPLGSLRVRQILVCLCLLALPACSQQMGDQPSYRPLTASDFFADGRSARPIVTGTVAHGQLQTDSVLYTGRDDKGELAAEFPFEMTKEVLERGKQRYTIFCSVCHGLTGHGDGRIVKRGFTPPPNYITDLSRSYKLRGQEDQAHGRARRLLFRDDHQGLRGHAGLLLAGSRQ